MSTDFDVSNYSLSDLLHIVNMHNTVPLTKAKINEGIEKMLFISDESQQKFRDFFIEIGEKLKIEKDLINKDSGYYENSNSYDFITGEKSKYEMIIIQIKI